MNLKRAPLCELGLGQEREEASVEGLRENRAEEGTPYAVGVHVDWCGKRWRWKVSEQALEADDLELLGCVVEGGGRF